MVDPAHAIEHGTINNGSWKGVYGHKAILGRIAAVAVTVAVYVRPRFLWERAMRWSTIAIFVFLAIQSQSRASWLLMGGGVAFMLLLAVMRNKRFSAGIKMTIATGLGLAVAGHRRHHVQPDTGRVRPRRHILGTHQSLGRRGCGRRSSIIPFWAPATAPSWTVAGSDGVRDYVQSWVKLPSHGHNGYLDIWLELGYAGLALFAVFALVTIWRLISRLLREPGEPAWAALAIFFFVFLLNNISVTVAFKHTDIAWIFAVLACLYTRGCVSARLPIMGRAERKRLRFAMPRPMAAWRPAHAHLAETR